MELKYLVERSRAGDVEAFEQLYKAYASRALRTVYLIRPNHRDAQDIVQEAFLQAWRGLRELRDTEAFHVWFYRILIRLIKRRAIRSKGYTLISNRSELIDLPDVNTPGPEELVERNEALTALRRAIDSLPPTLRVPLVLRYYSQFTEAEISQVLSIPPGTVKSRTYHARKRLGELLQSRTSQTAVSADFLNAAGAKREADAQC